MPSPLPGFDDTVDFAIEPIYGLRVFLSGPPGLYSVHQSSYLWSGGLNQNFCFSLMTVTYPNREPWPDYVEEKHIGWSEHDMFPCSCGFYGYHTRAHLEEQYRSILDLGTAVVGVIKATGKVVLGEKGFRAEKAEIVALSSARGRKKEVGATNALLYGVPFYPNPRALLEDYPTTYGDGSLTPDDGWRRLGYIN